MKKIQIDKHRLRYDIEGMQSLQQTFGTTLSQSPQAQEQESKGKTPQQVQEQESKGKTPQQVQDAETNLKTVSDNLNQLMIKTVEALKKVETRMENADKAAACAFETTK